MNTVFFIANILILLFCLTQNSSFKILIYKYYLKKYLNKKIVVV